MTTITKTISQSADDSISPTFGNDNTTNTTEVISTNLGGFQVNWRFQNITIPQGAKILYAHIKLRVKGSNSGNFSINVRGMDEDDIPDFSTTNGKDHANTGVIVTSFDSTSFIDLYVDQTANVQTIVDRAGWTSGNDMGFNCNDVNNGGLPARSVTFVQQDHSTEPEAALHIDYIDADTTEGDCANSAWDLSGTPVDDFVRDLSIDGDDVYVLTNSTGGTKIEIAKYDKNGTFDSLIDIAANSKGFSMDTDGTHHFVLDIGANKVFKYDFDGTLDSSWALEAGNSDGRGLAIVGNQVWVGNINDFSFYKYSKTGTFDAKSFTVAQQALSNSNWRIGYDGTDIIISLPTADTTLRVDTNGNLLHKFDHVNCIGANATYGMDSDGLRYYGVDFSDKKVYEYLRPTVSRRIFISNS